MAKKNRVRKWLRILHRDVGYLCAGLTVIYCVSGIAVNHVHHWNPNITVERTAQEIGPAVGLSAEEVLTKLGKPTAHKSTFRSDARTLQIFAGETTYEVDLPTGHVEIEVTETRPLLYESNFLHLNHAKKWWTWIADAFAVALIFLALSGLFMIKGRKGFFGRGKWFALAGVVIPLFFLWLYLP
ncbi:MAG: PepSY-associated TM helix domain-containing protein [Planctomycetes bacterium]|nr:PepSY-associated TM helix domain-containing protein [Planctomycetota bacterium]